MTILLIIAVISFVAYRENQRATAKRLQATKDLTFIYLTKSKKV